MRNNTKIASEGGGLLLSVLMHNMRINEVKPVGHVFRLFKKKAGTPLYPSF